VERGSVTLSIAICIALLILAGVAACIGLTHPEWLLDTQEIDYYFWA
jgi:hypothetical protein